MRAIIISSLIWAFVVTLLLTGVFIIVVHFLFPDRQIEIIKLVLFDYRVDFISFFVLFVLRALSKKKKVVGSEDKGDATL